MKTRILYGIYFLSGTAGLVYEVLWMRYFSRLFGNTAKGAAMVLVVFFLGMAGFISRCSMSSSRLSM